ncbi:hypothetical protein ACFWDT_21355 [Streptomyces diastaticus]|uniref:FAD-dependent oxidoreductase n=1 Tax=Streptomyces diastaticus TaxID=1956 RepID=UPI0036BCFF1C
MAGLSTAWELSRAGRSAAVLEAGRIASGVTARLYTEAALRATALAERDHLTRRAARLDSRPRA